MDADHLLSLNRPGTLFEPTEKAGAIRCLACAHRCTIPAGGHGTCRMRENRDGQILVPHGYVSALSADPVEKKPFFHFLPGATAMSFGMLGCNFRCPFCQNWTISQCLRDPDAVTRAELCSAATVVDAAVQRRAKLVASTYNEPLITTEWAVDIFKLAKNRGMKTAYISNGFASAEVLEFLAPWLDAMNVDLKCFSEEHYERLGGRLQPVLDSIAWLREAGKWIEVITLVVPEFNDSDEELADTARFIASVDPDIPWHVSAYHASYKHADGPAATPAETILKAVEIGRQCGLRHIYSGNLRNQSELADTQCPACGETVIERVGFQVRKSSLRDGECPSCGAAVAGVWG
jgi:pyruvate formate lyase activating enzyme